MTLRQYAKDKGQGVVEKLPAWDPFLSWRQPSVPTAGSALGSSLHHVSSTAHLVHQHPMMRGQKMRTQEKGKNKD